MGKRGVTGGESRTGALKVAVLVVGALLSGTVRAAAFRSVKEGTSAPDFTLKSTTGEEVTLSALKGKTVVLSFVTQGQDKSEGAVRTLSSLDSSLAGKANVYAVVGNAGEGDVAAWAAKSGVKYPVLVDSGKTAFGRYGVFVTPATGVVKADGVFQGEVSGYPPTFKDEVEGLLRVALGEASAEQVHAEAEKARGADESPQRLASRKELENARALVAKRKTDEALAAARRAVEADGSYVPARTTLGNLLLDISEGNADEAAGHFQKALEVAPKDAEARAGSARVRALKGDYEGAVAQLEEAARLNPRPQRVYYRLGVVHEKAGKYEQAVEAYRRALAKLLSD